MRLSSRKIILYTGTTVLLIMIIATRCLDFFFFFAVRFFHLTNDKLARRYTIGTFSGIGHYRGTIYKFDYKVGDSIFIVDTRFGLHDKDLNNLRLVVKYSKRWTEHSELLVEVVPKWVLAPPKDGWKQFPPDINWKGAELDTVYMKKMNLEIP
jgi:hypothetical protein